MPPMTIKKKEIAETKNLAEQLIYTTEKALRDAEGKMTDEIKKGVEEKVAEVKKYQRQRRHLRNKNRHRKSLARNPKNRRVYAKKSANRRTKN